MKLMSTVEIFAADLFSSDATQRHPAGTIGWTRDGRQFRYAKAGASDLVVGNILQASVPVANHLAMTPAATAIGATSVTLTLGATLATENQYAEGWLQVDTTPGNGYAYPVSGHPAAALSSSLVVSLPSDAPVQVALTTSSRVGLIANPWKGVIQCPTTNTARVVGAAVSVITASQWGWIQIVGPCPVLINGTPAITAPVVNSATAAGAVDKWTTAAADVAVTPVGFMMQVGVTGKNNMVFLTIE